MPETATTRTACIKGRIGDLGPKLERAPAGWVYVGRANRRGKNRGGWDLLRSSFHNPFSTKTYGVAGSLERYRQRLRDHPELVERARRELSDPHTRLAGMRSLTDLQVVFPSALTVFSDVLDFVSHLVRSRAYVNETTGRRSGLLLGLQRRYDLSGVPLQPVGSPRRNEAERFHATALEINDRQFAQLMTCGCGGSADGPQALVHVGRGDGLGGHLGLHGHGGSLARLLQHANSSRFPRQDYQGYQDLQYDGAMDEGAPSPQHGERRSFPIDPTRGLSAQIPADAFGNWPRGVIHRKWAKDMYGDAGVLDRFYGLDDDLLYIGITNTRAATRWNAHRTSGWWPLVRTVTVEPSFVDRTDAEAMERAAIIAERPRFNVIHLRRLKVISVRLDGGADTVVDQFRNRLLPEDFAALVAAFKAQPDAIRPGAAA